MMNKVTFVGASMTLQFLFLSSAHAISNPAPVMEASEHKVQFDWLVYRE